MTAALPRRPAARLRWCGMVAIVLLAQFGLIFWLGRTEPLPLTRAEASGVRFRLITGAPDTNALLADPTLFALPHRQSFSGPAWMMGIPLPTTNFVWSEPARPLELPTVALGLRFNGLTTTNPFSLVEAMADTPAEPRWPEMAQVDVPDRAGGWRVAGDLSSRRLLTSFQLAPMTNDDLLTNSVVQLIVDPQGWPISIALLPPGSGSKEADRQALRLAASARFEPLPDDPSRTERVRERRLQWGDLIFEWQTVPAATANGSVITPK